MLTYPRMPTELESRQVLPGEIELWCHVYPGSEWIGRVS